MLYGNVLIQFIFVINASSFVALYHFVDFQWYKYIKLNSNSNCKTDLVVIQDDYFKTFISKLAVQTNYILVIS